MSLRMVFYCPVHGSPWKGAKLCLQIIHGALEHKERYYPFIQYLNQSGYSVIISDTRGHGASVNQEYPPGYMNGVQEIVSDQLCLTRWIQSKCPGLPIVLFGHSLGSCFARCYLQEHDHEIVGLVMSGTANYIPAVPLGLVIGRICTFFSGKHSYSRILHMLDGGDKAADSWISYNKENLIALASDPLYIPRFQNGGTLTVFSADRQLKMFYKYRCQNPELKILLVSGEDDPVTGGEKGIADTVATLQKIGYNDIQIKVYSHMKHEVLNEKDNERVFRDIIYFLKKCEG